MPRPTRPEPGQASTAERITAAALALFDARGPDGVTVRAVARAVGITPMAIYHHFPDRAALLTAVGDAEFERLLQHLERRRPRGARPLRRLREMMEGYLDYALARRRVFAWVLSAPRPGARRFPGDFRARRSPTMNLLADAVEEAMRAGELARADEWEVALAVWAHVHGYAVLFLGGRIALDEDRFRLLCRRSLARLLRGLAS